MKDATERFYDVIVAGAGPAGATLSYELARRGASVLLLEKEKLPRYKPCAGGITVKAANCLGLDIAPVTRSVVRGVRVTYKGHRSFTKWYDKPLILTVMRDEFDHLLVRRAKEAGVTVIDNEAVCRIEISSQTVKAATAGKTLESRIIVGADGARSAVARDAGLMRGVNLGMGMEAETSVAGEKLVQWDSLVGLDLGHIRGGYGWVFPKKDHLSIGVGGPLRQVRRLRSGYCAVLKSYDLETGSVSRLRSHYLPVRRKGMAIQSKRCLLLGDAAGLVDPLTGEGIHHAVRSAQLAAPVIHRYLQSDSPDLREYQDAVDREIMPELTAARGLARLFSWFPGLCFGLVEGHDRLWRACCRLLRGEETYVSIKQQLYPFEGLFDLLTI
jgi:geranylgeranyl reductase family protein